MDKFRNYNIVFTSLPLGKSDFEFELAQSFFDLFGIDQDFESPHIKSTIVLDKKSTILELAIHLEGNVTVACDLTGDKYEQSISNSSNLVIKFGHEFDDTDSEIWIIPHDEYQINVAQILYELSVLSIPVKRIHPDVLSGKSNSEMINLLEQYSISELDEESSDEESDSDDGSIDPRWSKLKDLKP